MIYLVILLKGLGVFSDGILSDGILKLLKDDSEQQRCRKDYVSQKLSNLDGKAAEKCAAIIEDIIYTQSPKLHINP